MKITRTIQRVFGKKISKQFLTAIDLFNKRLFWEAHEVFEDVWRLQEGDVKKLAQGFVQAAAAFSYIEKRRYESILYLFDKSIEKLSSTIDILPGVNINDLIEAMKKAKQEAQRHGESELEKFDSSLYPSIKIGQLASRSRVRSRRLQS